jgi:hypothetical protein
MSTQPISSQHIAFLLCIKDDGGAIAPAGPAESASPDNLVVALAPSPVSPARSHHSSSSETAAPFASTLSFDAAAVALFGVDAAVAVGSGAVVADVSLFGVDAAVAVVTRSATASISAGDASVS